MDKPKANKSPLFVFLPLIAVLLFSTFACSFTNIRWMSGDQATVTVIVDEDTINSFSKKEIVHAEPDNILLDDVTRIDMMADNTLRVYGTYRNADNMLSDGSYDATISAQNGKLLVEIIAVDMDGVQIDDPKITQLNERLAREITEFSTENRDEVKFKEVEVTDENITFVIEFDWKE